MSPAVAHLGPATWHDEPFSSLVRRGIDAAFIAACGGSRTLCSGPSRIALDALSASDFRWRPRLVGPRSAPEYDAAEAAMAVAEAWDAFNRRLDSDRDGGERVERARLRTAIRAFVRALEAVA